MKKKTKKTSAGRFSDHGTWLQYVSTLFIGVVIAVLVALYRGFSWNLPAYRNAMYFSDGFFVAGVIIFGLGALMLVATTGFFDMMSYGVRYALSMVIPAMKKDTAATFYDYKLEKNQKRGKPLYFMAIVGLVLLLLAGICLGLYYNLPG